MLAGSKVAYRGWSVGLDKNRLLLNANDYNPVAEAEAILAEVQLAHVAAPMGAALPVFQPVGI